MARPSPATEGKPPPRIQVLPDNRAGARPSPPATAILARIERLGPDTYEARAMRRLPRERDRAVVGIYRRVGGGGRLDPTDRRVKTAYAIARHDSMGARPGELVRAETRPGRRLGLPQARVTERLGRGSPVANRELDRDRRARHSRPLLRRGDGGSGSRGRGAAGRTRGSARHPAGDHRRRERAGISTTRCGRRPTRTAAFA